MAQFYTVDKASNPRHIETENPSEQPSVTPRDSSMSSIEEREDEIIDAKPKFSLASLVALPLKHIKISSKFGMRFHPIFHKNMMHNGVDLSAHYEPVYSMFPGFVIKIGYDKRSGNYVTVKSSDYTVSYCHLSKIFVHKNDFVNAGDILCNSGNTGNSTGPHLHLSLKKGGKAINPVTILNYIMKLKK